MNARTESAAARRVEPGEPEEPPARLRRGVEPRHEHGPQRERTVRIVEPVGSAAAVGEEQETDGGLCDEHGLREHEAMADESARSAPVGDDSECSGRDADGDRRDAEHLVDGYHRAHPIRSPAKGSP